MKCFFFADLWLYKPLFGWSVCQSFFLVCVFRFCPSVIDWNWPCNPPCFPHKRFFFYRRERNSAIPFKVPLVVPKASRSSWSVRTLAVESNSPPFNLSMFLYRFLISNSYQYAMRIFCASLGHRALQSYLSFFYLLKKHL